MDPSYYSRFPEVEMTSIRRERIVEVSMDPHWTNQSREACSGLKRVSSARLLRRRLKVRQSGIAEISKI